MITSLPSKLMATVSPSSMSSTSVTSETRLAAGSSNTKTRSLPDSSYSSSPVSLLAAARTSALMSLLGCNLSSISLPIFVASATLMRRIDIEEFEGGGGGFEGVGPVLGHAVAQCTPPDPNRECKVAHLAMCSWKVMEEMFILLE